MAKPLLYLNTLLLCLAITRMGEAQPWQAYDWWHL